MKAFMDEDFLLGTEAARRLFHDYAEAEPILDFHCHLPPAELARDEHYRNITQLWLGGDHYKWRLMRANGVPEELITGGASDIDKFRAWARTLPRCLGNPLYHWTHLELRRYFGVEELLDGRSADRVFAACNERIATPDFSARSLLSRMKVRGLCTTDDPADDLSHHTSYAKSKKPGEPVMVPTFRPDKALAIDNPVAWRDYLARLGAASGIEIGSCADLVAALDRRHEFFHGLGARLSDHALERPVFAVLGERELEAAFAKALSGEALGPREIEGFKAALLAEVGRMDARRGWTMQLHFGALRGINSRMSGKLGPDTGYDAIGDGEAARALAGFLDLLDSGGELPRVVLYTLNPTWNAMLAVMAGGFQDGGTAGKVQFGSAWWFNDHYEGMRDQMKALASVGLLSRFVGMLTDSRSFLSFPRHEYFRRILCGMAGDWMENGEIPPDFELAGGMVRDISYANARDFFRIPGVD